MARGSFLCQSTCGSFAFRAFKQRKHDHGSLSKPWLLKTTIFSHLLQILSLGVCWPLPESSACAFCQSHCQSNFVLGEQRLLWYNVISLDKHGLRTLQTGRNYMAPCIPDALLAISVSRPLSLQKICEPKKKVTTQKVNSSSVAKSGDKQGNRVSGLL